MQLHFEFPVSLKDSMSAAQMCCQVRKSRQTLQAGIEAQFLN
jgi:hypothetical protein